MKDIHLANPYSTRIETLPTTAERSGDFSQQMNTQGGLDTIYDPWTTETNGSTVTRQPFPGNVIPASRIDPFAKQVMAGLWQPNNPGDGITGANNFKGQLYDIYPYWNFMDRVDYNITPKLKFFARYNYLHTTETTSDYTGSGSPMRYFQGSARNAQNAAGDLVWTINPTTVFNVRTSYDGINDSFQNTPTEIGGRGWPAFGPTITGTRRISPICRRSTFRTSTLRAAAARAAAFFPAVSPTTGTRRRRLTRSLQALPRTGGGTT